MSGREDVCWEAVVETLDLDTSGLELAEQRLRTGGDDPLPAAAIEAMLAKSTGLAPVRVMPAPKDRRLTKVAAIVAGALVLAAAGSGYLVWRAGANSDETMNYPMAIELLLRPEQPLAHKLVALGITRGRIMYGISVLQGIQNDPLASGLLRDVSRLRLSYLRDLVEQRGTPTVPTADDTILAAGTMAQQTTMPTSERIKHVERLTDLTASGIMAVVAMRAVSPEVDRDRSVLLDQLRATIRH